MTGKLIESDGSERIARMLTTAQMAKELQVCGKTIGNMRKRGLLPYIRLGPRKILFCWESVQAALARMEEGGQA